MAARDASDITLFIGAGASVPSGAPDFKRLRDCFLEPLIGKVDDTVGMDAFSPELLFDALDDGRRKTRRMIRREMWRQCEACEPGINHHAIAALGAAGARVWTTNFDTLIERAAHRLDIPWRTIAPPTSATDAEGVRAPGRLVLLKAHGSFPYTGDPADEPSAHDYRLLFRATDVWRELQDLWGEQLLHDFEGREVHLFGYRGADLDLVPVLLRALPAARRVCWWEFGTSANFAALERRFGVLADHVEVHAGDPSEALRELARTRTTWRASSLHDGPAEASSSGSTRGCGQTPRTWAAKAAVRGQFRGASAARRAYAGSVLLDPWPLKRRAAWRILRSTSYDRPAATVAVLATLRHATRVVPARWPVAAWELYATLFDVRPLSLADDADLARLTASPVAGRAELLVRRASKEKRMGRLVDAAAHAEQALVDLRERGRPSPPLEAMAAYNLAWIERQRWRLEDRERLIGFYRDRLAYIGFNWAAWLQLDEVLLALDRGDAAAAAAQLDGAFLAFAHERMRHPAYLADEAQARALVAWCREGPGAARPTLEAALRHALAATGGRLGFSAVDTLILLGEQARVTGRRIEMERRLDEARAATRSSLQRARIALVETVADGDAARLEAVRRSAARDGFGLLEASATAAAEGRTIGGAAASTEPLAGLC